MNTRAALQLIPPSAPAAHELRCRVCNKLLAMIQPGPNGVTVAEIRYKEARARVTVPAGALIEVECPRDHRTAAFRAE